MRGAVAVAGLVACFLLLPVPPLLSASVPFFELMETLKEHICTSLEAVANGRTVVEGLAIRQEAWRLRADLVERNVDPTMTGVAQWFDRRMEEVEPERYVVTRDEATSVAVSTQSKELELFPPDTPERVGYEQAIRDIQQERFARFVGDLLWLEAGLRREKLQSKALTKRGRELRRVGDSLRLDLANGTVEPTAEAVEKRLRSAGLITDEIPLEATMASIRREQRKLLGGEVTFDGTRPPPLEGRKLHTSPFDDLNRRELSYLKMGRPWTAWQRSMLAFRLEGLALAARWNGYEASAITLVEIVRDLMSGAIDSLWMLEKRIERSPIRIIIERVVAREFYRDHWRTSERELRRKTRVR